jgi:hypothetical protein
MNEPPEERLWRLMRGALTARALALVAGLGVADAPAVHDHRTGSEDTVRAVMRSKAFAAAL